MAAAAAQSGVQEHAAEPLLLTINGGSSSIRFALYTDGERHRVVAAGKVDAVGSDAASLIVQDGAQRFQTRVRAGNHAQAAGAVLDWLAHRVPRFLILGIGHRIVFGGLHIEDHRRLTAEGIAELRRYNATDLTHLPLQLALIERLVDAMPQVPQVGCFDTVFHKAMPRVARLLPIPPEYGIRRLGFHGLSYEYLMEALAASDGASGRVILAHLGSGASMAGVHDGRAVDTTMSFTPIAGLMMSTRPGDLDPGVLAYLVRAEGWTSAQLDDFLNNRCGLLGVSGTSGDIRELLAASPSDVRAAEAVQLFCYRARQWIGSLAASLGGLDTLVFSGGIGERSPHVRAEICRDLEFLGISIDSSLNASNAATISTPRSKVRVRVIPTDEELMIARATARVLHPKGS